jgi:Zn-dependent protease
LTGRPPAAKEPLSRPGLTLASLDLVQLLAALIPLLLSLTVHEYAHAASAARLGDDTAARMGRLTLNPIAHVDPLGTIVLPLVLMMSGTGFLFGWAKPVPVNPARFRRDVSMGRGMALTAAAGPLANLALALATAIVAGILLRWAPGTLARGTGVRELVQTLIGTNILLALFNLIPVPPLDGSRIVDGYLPYRLRPAWERVTAFAPFLLLAVFFFGARLVAGPSLYLRALLYQVANFIGAA